MQPISRIYYIPIDGAGEELQDTCLVDLNSDGSANLEHLPLSMQQTYRALGVIDELHLGRVFPKEGAHFLHALLASSTPYTRFRLDPALFQTV
jgi:hypothetical protein